LKVVGELDARQYRPRGALANGSGCRSGLVSTPSRRGRMMLGGVLADVPLVAQLIIGVVIVPGLGGAIAWVIKRPGRRRLGDRVTRGQRPDVAVVDAAVVDERRRLILVRRDNTEHLMMIGGPNDLVIEANIAPATTPRRVRAPDPSPPDATLPPDE